MTYILDTNILLHTVRNTALFEHIDSQFDPYGSQHETIISAVSVGEIYALAKKNRWGNTKILMVKAIIRKCNIIPVEGESLMEIYADIDAFSDRNHPTMMLSGSARTMGKNGLWIASTSAIFRGILLTTDGDFNHLHNVFFKVEYIDPQLY